MAQEVDFFGIATGSLLCANRPAIGEALALALTEYYARTPGCRTIAAPADATASATWEDF